MNFLTPAKYVPNLGGPFRLPHLEDPNSCFSFYLRRSVIACDPDGVDETKLFVAVRAPSD
jgi:hypothetical protein